MHGGELLATLEGPGRTIKWLQFTPDGETLLAGDDQRTAVIRAPRSEAKIVLGTEQGPVSKLAVSSDGKTLYSAGPGGVLKKWNTDTGEATSLRDFGRNIRTGDYNIFVDVLALSPDNKQLVIYSVTTQNIHSCLDIAKR